MNLRSSLVAAFSLLLLAEAAFAAAGISVTKSAERVGRQVQYEVVIANTGDEVLTNVAASDDLDAAFGAGNYTILSAPTRLEGPATVSANGAFDGSIDMALVSGGSLAAGEFARIGFAVELSTLGVLTNTVDASATAAVSGSVSDSGSVTIDTAAIPRIGAAKAALVSGTQVTLTFVIGNYGNRDLENVSLVDDLDAAFGAGQYSILSGPTVLGGTVVANGSFDGSADTNLLSAGSTLTTGTSAEIELVLDLVETDVGNGLGVYANQAEAAGQTEFGQTASDLSTQGFDPDPNGNQIPTEGGENVATAIVLSEEPVLGVAKAASVAGSVVTLDLYLENLGNVELQSLSLVDDLNAVFGAGNYYISAGPTFVDDPGSLTLNGSYDGNFATELLAGGSLAAGDTAQIRVEVTVIAVADMGSGVGNYANSVTGSAFAPGGGYTEDQSDDGTDPDPNGNGYPGDAGESDPTSITVAPLARVGIAKQYVSGGVIGGTPVVYLYFTITNYGNQTVSALTVDEDLNAVYGAGNYSHLEDPTYVSGSPTLNYNASFNGNTNVAMLNAGSFLAPGESTTFLIGSRVTNVTDQGSGPGVYQNQVTVEGEDPSSALVSDLSHQGSDPDGNGNGDPTDDADPTVIDVNQVERIGVAKDVAVNGNEVTFDFYLENLGDVSVSGITLRDDLDAVFGAGNYFLNGPPAFVDDPGTLTLDAAYSGDPTAADILDPSNSSLVAGDTASIRFVVTVVDVANHQGLGLGNYSNQVTVRALSALGVWLEDTSDFGTDPDPDGDGQPNEAGENDATTFALPVAGAVGVAKTAAVSGFNVTFDLYLENFGAGTMSGLSLVDDLDATFGAGNYTISTLPYLVSDPGTLALNPAYDGSAENDLLAAGSDLAGGATAQIQFEVLVTTESDQGYGYGVYQNQAVAAGTDTGGLVVSDLSDDGTDPDPNGNGDPGEAGEEDPTAIVIIGNPAIGIAKQAIVSGTQVTFEFTIENLGDVTLTNLFMEDPLNPVFGSGNYSILTQPTLVEGPGTLSLSPQFFGFNIFSRIVAGGYLRPGERSRFRTVISVNTVSDQGNGFGIYHNQVTVTATDPGGNGLSDVSDAGYEPDANGNGDAGDAGEDDITVITLGDEGNIGVAKDAAVVGQQVTFDYYLENFGGSAISSLSLADDLDAVFGAGNYSINTGPTLLDDPGTINLNGAFDGSTDTALIAAGSSLPALDTAQIRLVVDVTNVTDLGSGVGIYQNQVTLNGTTPLGSAVSDLSDYGTDPDPSGNSLANDAGESDPTPIVVGIQAVGVAKEAVVSGRQVTFRYAIENLGDTTFTSVSLPDDLDAVFGPGNYTLVSGPTLTSTPRNLDGNSGFDGSADLELIAAGSSIGPGVTDVLELVVRVDELADLGSGLGVYSNQVTVDANSLTDLSDDGSDPDPNGNGNATEAGENDPTVFSLPQEPVVGVAKRASVFGRLVTLDLYLESFANVTVGNLSLSDDLAAVFGTGNYTITSAPALMSDPGTLNLNGGYDGDASADLLAAGSSLAIGATAHIQLVVRVDTVTDQGGGLGSYANQAQLSGQAPDGTPYSDLSDDGTDPDPDGSGLPDDAGEDDATAVVLRGSIGDSVFNDLDGDGVHDAGELGLSGLTVYLDSNGNDNLDGGEPSHVTDGSGGYLFENLPADSYRVAVVESGGIPAGFVMTAGSNPAVLTLYAGEERADVDFGYQQQDASIGGRLWDDADGDGVIDPTESGLAGVTVYLDANGNGSLDGGESSATSDASGYYDITVLPTGTYQLRVDAAGVPFGYALTTANEPLAVPLAAGEDFNAGNFGYQRQPAPLFGKAFSPNPAVEGEAVALTFTIDNTGAIAAANDLAFSDPLPAGLVVATPANAATDCTGGMLTAVAGGNVVTYSGGSVAAGGSCTVSLDVVAANADSYANSSGDLTSSFGNSGGADATLVVNPPVAFSKAFSPEVVRLGHPSTLTFLLDNSAGSVAASALAFTDTFPGGMSVAAAPNAATTCSGGSVSAVAGSGSVAYSGGEVAAGASCTVSVDVVGSVAGALVNLSGDLTSSLGNSGTATATLTVADSSVALTKAVVGSPTLPGGLATLRYTISNFSAFGAASLGFSDDFASRLPGAEIVDIREASARALPDCGAGADASGVGTGLLSFSGGSLAAGDSCSFEVDLEVPVDAADGSVAGAASALTGTLNGAPFVAVPSDAAFEVAYLVLDKAFSREAAPGQTVGLRFTITNPDPANSAENLAFSDDLTQMGPGFVAVNTPLSDVCGAGSSVTGTTLVSFTGGTLAPGESCEFEVAMEIPQDAPLGDYANVTSALDATVRGNAVSARGASSAGDSLSVVVYAIPLLGPWGLLVFAGLLAGLAATRVRRKG